MVRFHAANELMEQLMQVPIFDDYAKRQMLNDDDARSLDPNLIMNERHELVRQRSSQRPLTKSSPILAEAQRLLSAESREENQRKKEREFLERELRKFEIELSRSREKFHRAYACSKKNLTSSNDEDFWRSCIGVKAKDPAGSTSEHDVRVPSIQVPAITAPVAAIKITIKEKPTVLSEESRLSILQRHFRAWKANVDEERHQREITEKIERIAARRRLKVCFEEWRTVAAEAKRTRVARTMEREATNMRKIEAFVNTIVERQRQLATCQRGKSTRKGTNSPAVRSEKKIEEGKGRGKVLLKRIVVESPAQNRLDTQKKVIEEQKMKLAEQKRIINELLTKQVEEEIVKSGEGTLRVARGMLEHCGQQTRRNLIQLLRQEGCVHRVKSEEDERRATKPPKFLQRMEVRASARRERTKRAEEDRRKALVEQKRKEEVRQREVAEERRRLQREAAREAKRLREEQARHAERCKKLNELADRFYRRYLLQRYIMDPFAMLIQRRNNEEAKAANHYKRSLMRKFFMAWREETENRYRMKVELGLSVYHRNLLLRALRDWIETAREQRRKHQVANDFHDLKLQERLFKLWRVQYVESKVERLEKEHYAQAYYCRILKTRCFKLWRRYIRVASKIKESEKRKDEWREIVQEIIPDFNPQERGVLIED